MFAAADLQICRFCQHREDQTAKISEANNKIDALTRKLETLQEFVTLNVGVSPSSTVAASTPTSTRTVPTVPTSVETTNAEVAAPTSTDNNTFHTVRNNIRLKTRNIIPVTECQNRFQILSDLNDQEETEEVRLVGDSMVRGQLTEFCARSPKTRKRFCIPGGGVDDVVAAVDEVSKMAPANALYVIHVGSNDVQRTRSEELLLKYQKLIKSFKEKSSRIIVSGIIPRLGVEDRFYNVATSTNRCLAEICKKENVGFVNTWDNFYYDDYLFSKDGVHLNQVGAARFGRLLNDAVKDFRKKQFSTGQPGRTVDNVNSDQ